MMTILIKCYIVMDTVDWDYILGNFNGFDYDEDDAEDNYNEMIHESIDDYVGGRFDYDNKELVEKYGVFDAIALYGALYNNDFGDWQLSDSKRKNYGVLAYMIIYDEFMGKYDFDTMKEQANDKLSDSE